MGPDRSAADDRRRRDELREQQQRAVDPDLYAPAPSVTGVTAGPLIWLAISAGGILGTLARYGVGRAIHVAPGSFPWATFIVNVTGSFVLGVLLTLVIERWPPSRYVRPFAAIGFLGAYTTFSTWMVEADVLVKDGFAGIAAAYVAASLVVGLIAVYVGIVVARVRGT